VIITDRTILHVDMNNFFASVELLFHPELKDKPVAVAGDKEQRHGIILAKNEIAKKYGVATASPIWQAQRLCPDLILLPPHQDLYRLYSKRAHQIYESYTDQIEPFGIDEAWLDVSGSLRIFGKGVNIADEIRMRFKNELQLTASVGISWNKAFAKLGSDLKKPDAVTEISRSNFKSKVWPLPLNTLLYAGKHTQQIFQKYGIKTIGELAELDKNTAERIAGKHGETLWRYANGLDLSPVAFMGEKKEVKSIGNSTTTPNDIPTNEDVRKVFLTLSESVSRRARAEHVKGNTVVISVRESSKNLKTYEKQCKLPHPTNLTLEIADTAQKLFESSYHWKVPIRSLGIRITDLSNDDSPEQLDLIIDETHRRKIEKLEHTVDSLQGKFGKNAIKRAAIIK